MSMDVIKSLLCGQLWARGALQYELFWRHGITPKETTKYCTLLKEQGLEHTLSWPYSSEDIKIYGEREVWERNRESFCAYLRRKDEVFNRNIGRACEMYFRAFLIQSRLYNNVTQKGKLGNAEGKTAKFDCQATVKGSGIKLWIEVKNRREYYYPSSPIFQDLIDKAKQFGCQPVLVVAHISPEGVEHCRKMGIALLHLGYQVVPKNHHSTRNRLDGIPPTILCPQEYCLINNPKKPFQHGMTTEEKRLYEIVSDPTWIENANKTWKNRMIGQE